MGFKDVRILKGGLGAWTNAGLPIESRSDLSQVGVELYKALAGERVEAERRAVGARIGAPDQSLAVRREPDALGVAEQVVPGLADHTS